MVVSVAFLVDLLCGFFLGRAGNSTLSVVSMLGGGGGGGGIPESLMCLGRCQVRQAVSACLVRCRLLTLLVSYVVAVQGSSD